jgi:hypothetical protein
MAQHDNPWGGQPRRPEDPNQRKPPQPGRSMAEPWTQASPPLPAPRAKQRPRPATPATPPQGTESYAKTNYSPQQPEPAAAYPTAYPATETYAVSGDLEYAYADSPAPPASLSWRQRLVRSWPFWSIGALVLVGGIGIASAISLFRIPNLPNCRAIVWVTASATTRIQCAEAYANQGTVEGYLDAIALVEELPDDHPLSHDIAQRVEIWAENILDLAEGTFQAGELQQAIGMARQIPNHTGAAEVVNERIDEWNTIWETAEAIYAAAEQELQALEFQNAFSQAIQLLEVGNDYWETVKYDQLSAAIAAARDDLNELGRAKRLAKQRTLQSMQEALEIVQSIDRESPLYNESQTLIRMFGRDLLAMAEESLDRRDVELADQMLAAIPPKLQMGEEIADMRVIMEASKLSWQGGLIGLEGGIVRLQSIGSDRPLYPKAQTLMRRWQDKADGLAQLEWAREVALPGTLADLQAAINEADKISPGNPVWDDAQAEIQRWRGQIQTAQDRPFLIQADQLAQVGDLPGAIAAARQVAPGRALYPDAQEKITTWRRQLQRNEDGPILAQAQQLANAGQWQAAITMASRIQSGRVLYADAQANIDTWQGQIQGQQDLQRAYQAAQRGRIPDLIEAIEIAQAVPATALKKPKPTRRSPAGVGISFGWPRRNPNTA